MKLKYDNMNPIYQYHLQTWGGFYNDKYKIIHEKEPGDYIFSTEEDRSKYVNELKQIEIDLNARHLMIGLTEGFTCNVITKLHRVIEFDGKQYYSECDMGVNYPYDAALYHMEYKWYPGFNDYPIGENFNYEKVTIISEWITGAFVQDLDKKYRKE